MGRERDRSKVNKSRWIDAPDDGRNDTKPSREKAVDRPVLVLTRQDGRVEQGWRGTPFYWPVLVLPQNMQSGIYTLNSLRKFKAPRKQFKLDFSPIDPNEILQLPIRREFLFLMLLGAKKIENRCIQRTNCSLFLEKDFLGNYIRVEGTDPDKYYNLSSYNNGVFPFEIRQYKYIYFRASQDYSGSQALFKLDQTPYDLVAEQGVQTDIVFDESNVGANREDDDVCSWMLKYKLGKLLKKKLTPEDEEIFEDFKVAYENGEIEYEEL
jgi:hypothetical protein